VVYAGRGKCALLCLGPALPGRLRAVVSCAL
jgi:hypothetical protein